MSSLHRELRATTLCLDAHGARLEDIENTLCRNNVRIVGFSEKVEGNNPVVFIENWLQSLLGAGVFTPQFAVERAQRLPCRPPPPGAPPRPFLLKCLNYKDSDIALQKARQLKELYWEGSKAFSISRLLCGGAETMYSDVKCRLRQHNIPYSTLYPVKVWVVAHGNSHIRLLPPCVWIIMSICLGPLCQHDTRA